MHDHVRYNAVRERRAKRKQKQIEIWRSNRGMKALKPRFHLSRAYGELSERSELARRLHPLRMSRMAHLVLAMLLVLDGFPGLRGASTAWINFTHPRFVATAVNVGNLQ